MLESFCDHRGIPNLYPIVVRGDFFSDIYQAISNMSYVQLFNPLGHDTTSCKCDTSKDGHSSRQTDWNWWWTIKIGVKIPSIFTKTMWRDCRKTLFGAWMFPQTFWFLPVVSDRHPKMKDEPGYGMKEPGLVSFGNIVHTRMQNKWRFSTAMLGGMSLPHLPGIFPEEGVGGQDGTDAARRHQVQDTSEGQSSACDHPEDQELMGHGMGRW